MKKICPDCGKTMRSNHSVCYRCSSEPYGIICPVCRGEKTRQAKACPKCTNTLPRISRKNGWKRSVDNPGDVPAIDQSKLSSDWLYQFVGLFCGEGTANLKPTNMGTVVATISLTLRSDDTAVINDIADRLGGEVRIDNHGKNPQHRWQVSRVHQVLDLCNLILSHATIPAKKLKEVEIVKSYCEWRLLQPMHGADFSYAFGLLQQIRGLRIFKMRS